MTTQFKISGFEKFGEFGEKLQKDLQRQIDLASKAGVNKSLDYVIYGRTTGINARSVTANSVVGRAAQRLNIPKEHIYYRTFTRGIKVSVGRGRGTKPFASTMIRGNGINIVDLLLNDGELKKKSGFKSRRRGVSGKSKIPMKSKVERARGGKRSGRVTIGNRSYSNAYLENGKYRSSSAKIDAYYRDKYGADSFKLGDVGNPFFLFERKSTGQDKPYPVKAIKITSKEVMQALNSGVNSATSTSKKKIEEIQEKEVNKRLKKMGII